MDTDVRIFETPENRAPAGAEALGLRTADGAHLRVISVPPSAAGLPRGTVVLMNGRAEFLERYYETMRDLSARGFHVVGFDWRGQGGSSRLLKDRLRGHVRTFRQYDTDLRTVLENLVLPRCPAPYVALAHSTGGHILMRHLLGQTPFTRALITAPLMDFRYGRWPPWLAALLSSIVLAAGFGWTYLPGYRQGPFLLTGFDGNPLTSDSRRWGRDQRFLEAHPELGVGGPTYSWFNAALRSFKAVQHLAPRKGLGCPLLVILAGRERIVDNRSTQAFIARVPGVACVTIANALHEIMMESDGLRAEFLAALDSFTAEI
jgi:lysophospholipase